MTRDHDEALDALLNENVAPETTSALQTKLLADFDALDLGARREQTPRLVARLADWFLEGGVFARGAAAALMLVSGVATGAAYSGAGSGQGVYAYTLEEEFADGLEEMLFPDEEIGLWAEG